MAKRNGKGRFVKSTKRRATTRRGSSTGRKRTAPAKAKLRRFIGL